MNFIKLSLILTFLITGFSATVTAQQTGGVSGQVFDTLNAVVVGATVTVTDSAGKAKTTTTNRQGEFSITGLAAGKYTVKVSAPKFSLYENTELQIVAGKREELTVALSIESTTTEVEVNLTGQVDQDPSNNASATVLKGKDIDELPDDPDELQAYLQALAGPSAGPDGAQISIDGFSGGRLPPKEAIREIRFNQNPFSAEYDRIGFGRVEILTKPGFDKFRGGANFNFNDARLNSRNPFSTNRAPSQTRNFGGNLSGPIAAKKSSFFVDFNYSQNDNSNVINATILDASNNIVAFNQDVTVPGRRFSISPRVDFSLNDSNTVQMRYDFSRNTSENQGVGGFSLPSLASESSSYQHEFRVTESMIINAKTVNETRFQFEYNDRRREGDNSIPTINVSSAFVGGGAQVGLSYTKSKRWELQNYTTTSVGKDSQHALKFGLRVRGINIEDRSESGYGGSFTFAGVPGLFSSIEQYRQKVLGNPDPIFNPTQFNITAGDPVANVSQIDYSLFITDDWKARKDLTLSFGLRYENQNNIKDSLNFAPRFGFAWQPGAGGARQPKTVIRGGIGMFYERFNENNTLTADRLDGVSQLRYTVTNNPAILGQAIFTNAGVTNVPTIAQLTAAASIPYRVSDNLQVPYSIQSVVSVERQLPWRSTASVTFVNSRSLHNLRIRNINAPVCPPLTLCPTDSAAIQALRPNPAAGNIYQYESSGTSNTRQLVTNFSTRFSDRITLFGNYVLGFANGDTDSLSSPRFQINSVGFPAYSYDLSGENGPSAFNARHTFFLGGSIGLPWGIRISPTIIASSQRRFNIVSGVDSNRDSLFFERPTYSELNAVCTARGLTNSFCNISGIANPSTTIIPRNYGFAPGSFNMNMNLSKTFGFGKAEGSGAQGNERGGAGGRGGSGGGGVMGGMMGGGGGRGGMGGFFGGGDTRKPYNLTIGINVRNVLNTVNDGTPSGSLTSPFFGRSNSSGGGFGFFGGGGGSANRRVDVSARFNW